MESGTMSIVSSRATSVASILKGAGVRAKLIGQKNRVNFRLPKNLREILLNYEKGCDRKVYEDFICILRDSTIKDKELLELIVDVKQCLSLLSMTHKLFVTALLNINWTVRSPEVTEAFKALLEDLVCVHIYHCKFVIDQLVSQFKPATEESPEWEDGVPLESDIRRLNHVHDVINKFLKIVPMCSELLMQSLSNRYPYHKVSTHAQEIYMHSLLQITEYAPQLRSEILSLIINRLVILDVNTPRSVIMECEAERMENEDQFHMEGIDEEISHKLPESEAQKVEKMHHPLAHTLDVCMMKLFSYIHRVTHRENDLDIEALKIIYVDLLHVFETTILTTWSSHHVQFVMFYLCGMKSSVADAFLDWLWLRKVSNPNAAPVIRQSAVAYIASLIARANFISIPTMMKLLQDMSTWVHSYIAAQDSLECANSDVRVHGVFYSVCQAMFYIIGFRHFDLTQSTRLLMCLQSLNLTKIVTCRLNPLRVCVPTVVQHFAAVTRTYQLAYCYTVMERNSRSNIPVVQSSNRLTPWLDTFFPFDPYVLKRSGKCILVNYMSFQGNLPQINEHEHEQENARMFTGNKEEDDDDDDDYMIDSTPPGPISTSTNRVHNFSYSTSPGFRHP